MSPLKGCAGSTTNAGKIVLRTGAGGLILMDCANCGEPMHMREKDTSSGRDIREYQCPGCAHEDWEVNGPALWHIPHDDCEEFETAQAVRANPQA